MTTTVAGLPACPKCGGKVWDNREGKRNPKAPDFKCRDKSCDGAIWPPKGGQNAKQGYDAGAVMPWETAQEAAQVATPAPVANVTSPTTADALTPAFELYAKCLTYVLNEVVPKLNKADIGTTPEAIVAATATLYINANSKGLR